MNIDLTTIIFLISHIITFYYLNNFIKKIGGMLKKIEKIEENMETKEREFSKEIESDLEKERQTEKNTEKSMTSLDTIVSSKEKNYYLETC